MALHVFLAYVAAVCLCYYDEIAQQQVIHIFQGEPGRFEEAVDAILQGVAVKIEGRRRLGDISLVVPHRADKVMGTFQRMDAGFQ